METLKQQLKEALILHNQEELSNRDILKADRKMLNVINDNRLQDSDDYEELIKWFIDEVLTKIDIAEEVIEEQGDELNIVDQEIYNLIKTMPSKVQHDIWRLNSGSKKQLRAKFVINTKASNDYYFAALIELLHLATLIQDDVIDNANQRRHKQTINAKYSKKVAILISDVLLVSIVKAINQEINNRIDQKTNRKLVKYVDAKTNDLFDSLLESEVSVSKIDSIDDYNEYAINKTAKLFGYSTIVGAISKLGNDANINELETLYQNGVKIGLLFQKIDDYIDYSADIQSSGKDNRDIENNIKNYMYFQLKTSSMGIIKTDLIKKVDLYIEQMPEYTEELVIIKRSIQ